MKPFPSVERQTPGGRDPFRRPSRNQHLRRSRRRRFLRQGTRGLLLLTLALVLAGWGGVAAMRWLHGTPLFAIDHIVVEGLQRGDEADLQRRLSPWLGRNLLASDLNMARLRALESSWVQRASVRRILPDTLAVRVQEKQPVAAAIIDGVIHLLDARGAVITPWSQRLTGLDLPLMSGLEAWSEGQRPAQLRAGMAALQRLVSYGTGLQDRLSEINLAHPDRLTVHFSDEPAPVHLSREDVTVNLDHYLAIRGDIRKRAAAVQAIDLRWRGRVVVVPDSEQIAGNKGKDG